MLKKTLCISLVLMILLSSVSYASRFKDFPESHIAYDAVISLLDEGVIGDNDDDIFKPDTFITRSVAIAGLCNITDMPLEYDYKIFEPVFLDVPADHFAAGRIRWAYECGLIDGFGDGTLHPKEYITYGQLIKILIVYMGLTDAAEKAGGYTDGYIRIAEEYGLTESISFKPEENANLANICLMTYRAIKCAGYPFKETQE